MKTRGKTFRKRIDEYEYLIERNAVPVKGDRRADGTARQIQARRLVHGKRGSNFAFKQNATSNEQRIECHRKDGDNGDYDHMGKVNDRGVASQKTDAVVPTSVQRAESVFCGASISSISISRSADACML